jgi:hypothetical protein
VLCDVGEGSTVFVSTLPPLTPTPLFPGLPVFALVGAALGVSLGEDGGSLGVLETDGAGDGSQSASVE